MLDTTRPLYFCVTQGKLRALHNIPVETWDGFRKMSGVSGTALIIMRVTYCSMLSDSWKISLTMTPTALVLSLPLVATTLTQLDVSPSICNAA